MADAPRAEKFKPLEDLPDTGTIADSGDRFRNLNPSLVAGPEDAPKDPQSWSDWVKTGWSSETYDASRADQRGDRLDFDEIKIRDGYQPIVDALGLGGDQNPAGFSDTTVKGEPILRSSTLLRQQGKGWLEAMTNRSTQEELIAAEIRARRAKDPKFLAGVPDTVAGLRAYFQQQEDEKRKTARAKLEAAPTGLGSLVSDFAGRAVESMHDPINIVTLPVGGGGKTGMQILGREILVNGGLELLQQPFVAQNRQEFGEELTLGEAATNVVTAGIAGGVLETGFHYGGKGIAAANRAAGDPVSKAFAKVNEQLLATTARIMQPGETPIDAFGNVGNRELVDFIKRQSGGNLTPDEQAAANILIRDEEIGDTSPFEHGPDGEAAHEGKLEDTINDLIANRRPQDPSPADGAGAPPSAPGRPPAEASTAARRPQAPTVSGEAAIAAFKTKTRRAESSGNDAADNPLSSADGRYQITDGTFRSYFKRLFGSDPGEHPSKAVKNNPATQERIMDALTRDNARAIAPWGVTEGNLYLAHFLGSGDAPRVLRADPGAPIERILSSDVLNANPFLKGKSASEVIAWAHKKMGSSADVATVSANPALEFADVGEDPAIARLRAEAANLDDAVIGTTNIPGAGNVPLYSRRIPASEALVDAARFQFKSGGDGEGVIDTLRGVKQWDPMSAGRMVFWQDNEGRYFVADGHQRSGLARRLEAEGHPPIGLDGVVLREADGITAEQARAASALVNIRNGSGSRVDAAKVLRDLGFDADLNLPPRSAFARDARGLAQLADDAFGAVVNERIAADIAAVVGRVLPDQPELHGGMIDILARLDPSNVGQAESIVRDALNAGVHSEEQIDLFGTSSSSRPLLLERAKIKERALGELRKMRVVHSTAAKNSGELEAKGSKIARAASEKEAKANAEAAEILDRLVNRAGPVSDELNAAAVKLAQGGKLGDVAGEFVAAVKQLDLQALARGAERDAGSLDVVDGSGRGGDAGEAGEAAPDEQPSLGDLLGATERFSDPDGPAVKQQADSLVHDLKVSEDTKAAFERERNSGFLVGVHAILDGGEEGDLGRYHWKRMHDPEGDWISVTDPSSGDPGEMGDDVSHLMTRGVDLILHGEVNADLEPEVGKILDRLNEQLRAADPEAWYATRSLADQRRVNIDAAEFKRQWQAVMDLAIERGEKPEDAYAWTQGYWNGREGQPNPYAGKKPSKTAGGEARHREIYERGYAAAVADLPDRRDSLVRFASGMSRKGDLTAGSYALGGSDKMGVGVEIGELSSAGMDQIARAIVDWGSDVFVDSGAFGKFRKQLRQGEAADLDFDKILARYDELEQRIHDYNEAEVQRPDRGRLLLVMPDVVGDQAASLALLRHYAHHVRTQIGGQAGGTVPIVPLQKGELSLEAAWNEARDILGTDQFVVGVPSNEAALSTAEFKQFLEHANPYGIHFLGAASEKTLGPKMDVLNAVSAKRGLELQHLTADANLLRSKLYGRIKELGDRPTAVMDTLRKEDLNLGSSAAKEYADATAELAARNKAKLDPAARREAIKAATEQLKDVKPGELRAVEPFPQDEPGYHRFRYVAEDGTAVGGNYTLDGGPPPFIEGFNVGDTNNPVKLGAKQTRAMFEQLKAQHPEATRIHAFRMTGARAEAGSGPKEIWIDLTGKGEGVQPEAVDVHAGDPAEDVLHGDAPTLDNGAQVDPAIAERQRQELQLRAASPLRPGAVDAKGEIGLPMFDKANQITFRLDEEGGEISAADLLAEIEADDKAIQTLKGCL